MSNRKLVDKTTLLLEKLPAEQLARVADFAEFLFIQQESEIRRRGVHQLNEQSGSFVEDCYH